MACAELSERELTRVLAAIQARADVDRSAAASTAPSEEPDEALIEILAVQREGDVVRVRTSASFRILFRAQAESDYYTLYAAIEETRLTRTRVTSRVLFRHSTMFTETHDDEAWLAGIAADHRTF